ncbi:hypothetical protein JRQ81_007157 [Phrynocephalus forsythii]|uniref:NHS-like protein 2 n=1 Tax=Phrynocephalus forsythii TaxID=171643 RepID=A0A9Q0XD97_9SAUR|nr:hypothetical protein JRQ81_007157 [Phrynocephalus forsythii]
MVSRRPEPRWDVDAWSPVESPSPVGTVSPAQPSPGSFFCPVRRLSEDSLEEEQQQQQLPTLPAERTPRRESRKAKVPPPVPKKPSVLYLPLVASPLHPAAGHGDARLPASPVIMLDEDSPYPELAAGQVPSPGAHEVNVSPLPPDSSWGDISGNSADLRADEKNFVNEKTAESITEEDDEVFVTSRTTEDLFTVIHRSKRKLLGWKEPSDAFGNRPNSQAPSKNAVGPPSNECPPGNTRTSSRNEDFKALLQKKGGKGATGIRTSAAELLKTTNPLARRVMTEFTVDGAIQGPKVQP